MIMMRSPADELKEGNAGYCARTTAPDWTGGRREELLCDFVQTNSARRSSSLFIWWHLEKSVRRPCVWTAHAT